MTHEEQQQVDDEKTDSYLVGFFHGMLLASGALIGGLLASVWWHLL
jgi:hypothetical protein